MCQILSETDLALGGVEILESRAMPNHLKATVVVVVLLFVVGYARIDAQVPTDPLSQMEITFQGNYSQAQIKSRLDRAMDLYGVPKTQENYSRAGSTLVALRKKVGHSEMVILDHMIRSHVPGVKISFPDAAGLAAAFLAVGDR